MPVCVYGALNLDEVVGNLAYSQKLTLPTSPVYTLVVVLELAYHHLYGLYEVFVAEISPPHISGC